jgi:glycosyltransferase involved in cell wall biosynthesis
MYKLLLSSFACDPTKGSEPGNGWNWAIGLANKNFEVHCLTRITGKPGIESRDHPPGLHFHYVALPLGLEKLYKFSTPGMYLYYVLWQWFAYKKAKSLTKIHQFKLAHHVTWGSVQMGSFMYRLNMPFIFGPAGGGQEAPASFKKYFLNYWGAEEKRQKVTKLMLRFNPACKNMIHKAHTVLVSNPETYLMANAMGAGNIHLSLDASLPDAFFPERKITKTLKDGELKLLWTGRFMPRKGILLLLDVMNELKDYKNITLTVVGDGEMREAFLETIKKYKLEDTVLWKGVVPYDEVKNFYRTHDVFFFTSLRDSCPAQLFEAMAYGMPVITLNLHGQGFIINDDTGIRCSAETPEIAIGELKDAILKVYNNSALVEKMSIAAFDFASKQKWNERINTIVEEYYPQS